LDVDVAFCRGYQTKRGEARQRSVYLHMQVNKRYQVAAWICLHRESFGAFSKRKRQKKMRHFRKYRRKTAV